MSNEQKSEKRLAEEYLVQVVTDFVTTLPPSARGPVMHNAKAAITVLTSEQANAHPD
jgi:hypothetical protein